MVKNKVNMEARLLAKIYANFLVIPPFELAAILRSGGSAVLECTPAREPEPAPEPEPEPEPEPTPSPEPTPTPTPSPDPDPATYPPHCVDSDGKPGGGSPRPLLPPDPGDGKEYHFVWNRSSIIIYDNYGYIYNYDTGRYEVGSYYSFFSNIMSMSKDGGNISSSHTIVSYYTSLGTTTRRNGEGVVNTTGSLIHSRSTYAEFNREVVTKQTTETKTIDTADNPPGARNIYHGRQWIVAAMVDDEGNITLPDMGEGCP